MKSILSSRSKRSTHYIEDYDDDDDVNSKHSCIVQIINDISDDNIIEEDDDEEDRYEDSEAEDLLNSLANVNLELIYENIKKHNPDFN